MHRKSKRELGQELYTVYCKATGGKNYAGEPLPSAEEFWKDHTKFKQSQAWEAVAAVARDTTDADLLKEAYDQLLDILKGMEEILAKVKIATNKFNEDNTTT